MGGKKRNEYGRYNVQNENARGQVKYTTPNEQMLFLIHRIERQQIQKALHAEEQQRQQAVGPVNTNVSQNGPVNIPARNPFSRN